MALSSVDIAHIGSLSVQRGATRNAGNSAALPPAKGAPYADNHFVRMLGIHDSDSEGECEENGARPLARSALVLHDPGRCQWSMRQFHPP